MDLQIRLLGGFEVSSADGDVIRISTRKARAILAVLARRSGDPHARETLISLLWPDSPDVQARASLRQALKLLRHALRGSDDIAVVSKDDALTLTMPAANTDIGSFEQLCRTNTPEALERAVDLYRGELLDGFAPPTEPFAEWITYERSDLHERAVSALSRLISFHADRRGWEPAVHAAIRLLALDPIQEHVHRLLMRIYFEQGRIGAAVAQYQQCHAALRRELGVAPEPETDRLYQEIRNGRLPAVASNGPATAPEGADGETVAEPASLLARPAVAVLPFRNLTGDPAQAYFSDGLSEDIITALTQWRSFPVIARNSTFAYTESEIDIKRAGQELGARYLLEGSIRRDGRRIRISAQLIDGESGHHMWAEKFDRELDDIFEVQDEIAQRIAAIVAPELAKAEIKRSTTKRPEDLDAWDYHLRGMASVRERTPEANAKARDLFKRAIEIHPDYADAYAGLAMSYNFDILLGYVEDRTSTATKAMEAAREAIERDENSSVAHQELSTAYQWLNRPDDALAHVRIAVNLNPNDAVGLHQLGNKSDLAGDPAGIAYMEKAQQLNPLDVQRHTRLTFLARAYLNAGAYENARDRARKAIQRRHDYPQAHFILALALAFLGRVEEGRIALSICDELQCGFVQSRKNWQPYADRASNESLQAALRLLTAEDG